MDHPTISVDDGRIAGSEIESLLKRVYVQGGFTNPAIAEQLFASDSVRARGTLLTAIDAAGTLAGTIIIVPPGAPACRIATSNESEFHLLAVLPDRRNAGLGQALIRAALERARTISQGTVLWTQPNMHAAQRLYANAGFVRSPQRDFQLAERSFFVFEIEFSNV